MAPALVAPVPESARAAAPESARAAAPRPEGVLALVAPVPGSERAAAPGHLNGCLRSVQFVERRFGCDFVCLPLSVDEYSVDKQAELVLDFRPSGKLICWMTMTVRLTDVLVSAPSRTPWSSM